MRGYVDSAEVQRLSKRVFQAEDADWSEDDWVNYEDSIAHPLVLGLLSEHGHDGVCGALAYLAEGSESDVAAVIRWMQSGAYKGLFDDEAEFARDQFEGALNDRIQTWHDSDSIGFVRDLDLGEVINWEYIGERLTDDDVFWHFVTVDSGVHVFDITNHLDDFREEQY